MFVRNNTTHSYGRFKVVAVHYMANCDGFHWEYHFPWKWPAHLCLWWILLFCPDYSVSMYRRRDR
jgi:hypothetical protein